MSGESEKNDAPNRLHAGLGLAFGIVVIVSAYWWLRWAYQPHSLAEHGALGDSMAPLAAVLSLAALVAALWSVSLQRRELSLQREEMKEARGEMVQQREQLKRTAEAQESLAAATERLATAQADANRLAKAAELAQRESAHAALTVGLANLGGAGASLVQGRATKDQVLQRIFATEMGLLNAELRKHATEITRLRNELKAES